MREDTRQFIDMWLAEYRARPIPPPALGCPCGCASKPPYLNDPEHVPVWPVREDPVCGACGTVLDPDGTCFTCPPPVPSPVQVFTGRCHACGKPGHMRAQCREGKRPDAG